jgi:hypothetical protein
MIHLNKITSYFILVLILFSITGCKEITTILHSPSITLISVKQISFKTFEIEIDIEQGEGQLIKSVELDFENLTILNSPKITEMVEIQDLSASPRIKHIFTSENINHDFKIKAFLNTDKYQYQSESIIYRSLKQKFYFSIEKDHIYNYLNTDLAIQLNKGGKFLLIMNYLNPLNKKLTVKLNKTIHCQNEVDLNYYWFTDNIIQSAGFVTIPDNIQPGDYSVSIEIDDYIFEYDKKIRVLEGEWTVFNENYPGRKMGDYAWFRIENLLYVVGGNSYASTILDSPVWCLDLNTGKWTSKNNFKWPPEKYPYSKRIFANQISFKNQGYILTQNDDRKIELWGYDDLNDNWNKVTDYPGIGTELLTCFNIENKVFVGGGVKYELNKDHNVYDFWVYDLESGKWNQLKDFPVRQKELWRPNTSCAFKGKGYVLEFPEKLWEYDPIGDLWILKNNFPGPVREETRIVGHDNSIYLIGGFYSYLYLTSYKDCWQYSFDEKTWKMRAFMPEFTNHNIAFSYDNSIIIGMGYAHNGYGYFDDHKIFRFTF